MICGSLPTQGVLWFCDTPLLADGFFSYGGQHLQYQRPTVPRTLLSDVIIVIFLALVSQHLHCHYIGLFQGQQNLPSVISQFATQLQHQ